MALSRSSFLHYSDPRFGVVPIIGSDPIFTRNSESVAMDERGLLFRPRINTPCSWWEFLPIVGVSGSERRPLTLLQPARTNLLAYSDDFSQWIVSSGTVPVANGLRDPFGGTDARNIGGGSVAQGRYVAVTFSVGNSRKSCSVFARKSSAPLSRFGLYDFTAGIWRHLVLVTWAADGTPTVTTDVGGGVIFDPVELVNRWWWLRVAADAMANANVNQFFIYPDRDGNGSTEFCRAQVEDTEYPTLPIKTSGATASRAAESLYWRFAHPPQAMAVYCELKKMFPNAPGAGAESEPGILKIGDTSGSSLYWSVYSTGGNFYQYHKNGASSTAGAAVVPNTEGDGIEMLGIVNSDFTGRIIISKNRAPVAAAAVAAPAGGMPSSFLTQELFAGWTFNGFPGFKLGPLKIAKLGDVVGSTDEDRMSELRAFELTPGGEAIT